MEKRIITEFEERVYRACHQDFMGLTQREAAQALQTSQSSISRALKRVEKKAPCLFPVLTHTQNLVYQCIVEGGLKHIEIAKLLQVFDFTVTRIVKQLRDKGICLQRPKKTLQYRNYMDAGVKQKF